MTFETPAPGLVVAQPARGFRYAADAFWLAGFASEGAAPGSRVLDLGTGSGIVALSLSRLGHDVLGVDVRAEWRACWAETLARSTSAGRIRLEVADFSSAALPPVDLVVANPPYFARGTGPSSPDPWKAAARTESSAGLSDVVRVGLGCAAPDGAVCLVLPLDRAEEAERACTQSGGALVERVDVGRRRALVRLTPSPSGQVARRSAVSEDDPRVFGWYAAVGARPVTSPR